MGKIEPNTKPIRAEIEKILRTSFAYGIDWTEYREKQENDHDIAVYAGKIKAELRTLATDQIIQLIKDEVIGEDETDYPSLNLDKSPHENAISRNQLRAEQRNKLTQPKGEVE